MGMRTIVAAAAAAAFAAGAQATRTIKVQSSWPALLRALDRQDPSYRD